MRRGLLGAAPVPPLILWTLLRLTITYIQTFLCVSHWCDDVSLECQNVRKCVWSQFFTYEHSLIRCLFSLLEKKTLQCMNFLNVPKTFLAIISYVVDEENMKKLHFQFGFSSYSSYSSHSFRHYFVVFISKQRLSDKSHHVKAWTCGMDLWLKPDRMHNFRKIRYGMFLLILKISAPMSYLIERMERINYSGWRVCRYFFWWLKSIKGIRSWIKYAVSNYRRICAPRTKSALHATITK